MKKFKFLLAILALALVLGLTLASCGGGGEITEFDAATAGDLVSALGSITESGDYLINVTGPLTIDSGFTLNTPGANVTVRGATSARAAGAGEIAVEFFPVFRVTAGKLTVENINLLSSQDSSRDAHLITIDGSGAAVVIRNVNIDHRAVPAYAVLIDGGGSLSMSGGTIRSNRTGIGVSSGSGSAVTLSGVAIDTTENGIGLWQDSTNVTLNISGGTISSNEGISIKAGGSSITVSGGTAITAVQRGIGMWAEAVNAALTINNGTINSGEDGIVVETSGAALKISAGTISGTEYGISIGKWEGAANVTLTISGGTITSPDVGLYVEGSGHTVKKTGGILSGANEDYYITPDALASGTFTGLD